MIEPFQCDVALGAFQFRVKVCNLVIIVHRWNEKASGITRIVVPFDILDRALGGVTTTSGMWTWELVFLTQRRPWWAGFWRRMGSWVEIGKISMFGSATGRYWRLRQSKFYV